MCKDLLIIVLRYKLTVIGCCKRFASSILYAALDVAGWSSLAARRAHNPKVVGSNPAPATKSISRALFGLPERVGLYFL